MKPGDVVTSVIGGRKREVRACSESYARLVVPGHPAWVENVPVNPVTGLPVGYFVEGRP